MLFFCLAYIFKMCQYMINISVNKQSLRLLLGQSPAHHIKKFLWIERIDICAMCSTDIVRRYIEFR